MLTTSVQDNKFSQRAVVNIITNVISLIISIIIGIFLAPYFLDTIGIAAYGLIPLATSITSYVTLLIDALNTAVARYLLFDLHSSKIDEANKTYNTAFFVLLVFVVILIPIALLISILSPVLFNIGDQASIDVIYLFSMICGSTLINMISANFQVTLFAYNRFDLRNYVTILRNIIQVILIVILFTMITPSLPFIGIAYIIAALASLILAIVFSRKTCVELTFGMRYLSKEKFKKLLYMNFWTIIKSIGCLLRSNIGLIIANIICGVIVGAQYSIVFIWQSLLFSLIWTVSEIFIPKIYALVAERNTDSFPYILRSIIKIISIFSALIIGLLIIYSTELLSLWIGTEYAYLAPLAIILILPGIIWGPASGICNVMIAKLRLIENAMLYCISGILVLLFSSLSAYFYGVYGLAIAGGLVLIFWEGGMTFAYTSRITGIKLSTLLSPMVPGAIMLILTLVIGYLVKIIFVGDTWLTLVIGATIVAVFCLLIITHIFFNKKDKTIIRNCLPAYLEKIIPTWLL